jgi:hypothetical protein
MIFSSYLPVIWYCVSLLSEGYIPTLPVHTGILRIAEYILRVPDYFAGLQGLFACRRFMHRGMY